ncbi:class I SAM-dependent methyltransferase [Isachenkonia alkalipeptolytica]|uniref:Class I SAM-dependent methyltransferase n=1 Tax=Isachenkonia alkalipeptolytica TaxID=2565777 RepID=A0AA43XHD6_9CLOT|nr:class I SAM-dependent methyltransferase [Isachenkonia alkalipeptolytica]NBG86950.1 class I SAM-dependent methyltransferase [Isachenkonia alkalipeptolytica]
MAMYDLFMKPFEEKGLKGLRKKLIPKARGSVLEIGPGTGLNLPYYDPEKISSLVLMDRELNRRVLEKKLQGYPALNPDLREENVTALPYPEASFDTVIFTLVFCTVADATKGFKEIKRVLKKDGKIIFIEHIRPETEPLGKTFDILTPLWKRLAKGCHLNRKTEEHLQSLGFQLELEPKLMQSIFVGGTGNLKKTAP